MESIYLPLLVFMIILGVVHLFETAKSKSFYEKWPPIDDDEFLRRCPPGTNRITAIKVRKIVSDCTGVEYEHIYPEQSFVNDLDCC